MKGRLSASTSSFRLPPSSLVLRDARVNVVRPGGDAALEVEELALEARARQRLDGAGAADAALAVDDRLAPLLDLAHALCDLTERDELCAGDARYLVLVWLAHVDDLQVVAAVDALFQLGRRDLFHPSLLRRRRVLHLRNRRPQAAELFVVDQLLHRRVLAADGALRVFPQLQLAEAQLPRVEEEQPVNQRLAPAEDELDGLVRLNRADDAGQHPQHTTFGAGGYEAGRRRLRIEAAVARAALRPEDARLPLEAEDRAVDVGLARQHARVVDEIARRKIVRPVHDHVVFAEQSERVLARQARLVRLDLHVRVDVVEAVARRLDLRPPDVLCAVDDLALEVRGVHHVEVHDAERADAGRRQIHPRRRAQAPRPDHQHARGFELALTLDADLGHDEVTTVTRYLVVRERGERRRSGRRARLALGRRAARDGRDDGDGVAILDRRLETLRVAYVLVVDVDVDEVAERVLLAVEMPAQLRVLAHHAFERLAHRARLHRNLRAVARELPQRRRYENCYRHVLKTPLGSLLLLHSPCRPPTGLGAARRAARPTSQAPRPSHLLAAGRP